MATKRVRMVIEPLTCLHIGNGNTADPFGMIVKDNHAIYINTNAYIRYLLLTRKAEFEHKVKTANLTTLMQYLYENFDTDNPVLYDTRLPVDKSVEIQYRKDIGSPQNQCLIYQFYRNPYRQAFIPGSSLKGCIRTAILSAIYDVDTTARPSNDLEFQLLGCMRDGRRNITDDPFKFIKIADAPVPDARMTLKPMAPHNIKSPASGTANLDFLYEVIQPGAGDKIYSELTVNMDFFQRPGVSSLRQEDSTTPFKDLCQTINGFYQKKLNEDLAELRGTTYCAIHTAAQQEFNHPEKKMQFIVKLGKGSGRHYISYKKTNLTIPKTRNLIDHQSVGWCKVALEQI